MVQLPPSLQDIQNRQVTSNSLKLLNQVDIKLASKLAVLMQLFRSDLAMGFYDLWVGRDANGAMFLKEEPYATDPYTLQRLPWGLPFPAKCCWNGLVALNAAPFTRHAVKIRYCSNTVGLLYKHLF